MLDSDPKMALELGKQTCVFGRCTPNDKVLVVSTFVKYGDICMMWKVYMCCCFELERIATDLLKLFLFCSNHGGNDCDAQKAANVIVALSNAEASIMAPFTSHDNSIESVIEVVKEGRCSLASSFTSYKYKCK